MDEKQKITEDMHLEQEWYKEAKNQTIETLPDFVHKLLSTYEHDYGTVCHAIAACTIAVYEVFARTEGITGAQHDYIKFLLLREGWDYGKNVGMKIVNYDEMLYPQNEKMFEKKIRPRTFKRLQDVAKEKLESKSNGDVAYSVLDHWKKIADGKPPFGYTISEED